MSLIAFHIEAKKRKMNMNRIMRNTTTPVGRVLFVTSAILLYNRG
jgi:hypothetical protein